MKEKEIERLTALKSEEVKLYESGIEYICGIDEAGRGPLAGPVVVGAVILPEDSFKWQYIESIAEEIFENYKIAIQSEDYSYFL